MSAGSNLQGAGGLTLEQRIANIEAALRGGPPVVDAVGVPTDDDVDLGSALNAWRDVFANGLVVGGARVDVAGLAVATGVYVFDANDPTFSWPANRTTALILLWSASGGGGGGGGGGTTGDRGEGGTDGGPGGASTVTISGMTYSSGAALGGDRGRSGGDGQTNSSSVPRIITDYSMPGALGGAGGDATGSLQGQGGAQSIGHVFKYFGHGGLSEGDTISIVVPAGGAAGVGGDGFGSLERAEDGQEGTPGMAIILALL